MPDKWAQYAVPAAPADKWAQYAQPAVTPFVAGAGALGLPQPEAHPAVTMNDPSFDSQTKISPSDSLLQQGLKSTVGIIGAPFVHPLNALSNLIPSAMPNAAEIKAASEDPNKPSLSSALVQGAGQAFGGLALGAAGGEALGSVLKAPPVTRVAGALGQGMQDLGAGILNSKFAPTMKEVIRGNDPGLGMLESGIGPTLTKSGLGNKIAGATEAVGSRIGNAVDRADNNALAPPILSRDLAPSLTGPINDAMGRINGPFGTASTDPYTTLQGKLGNTAPGASAPIYGPNAPETIAPSDLWKTIKNLDQNTRFNTDPEIESVNETRRDIRQGLRPSLEASDPTIAPLSKTYSNLLSANDAVARSQGGFGVPKGLSSLIDSTIKSTPAVTTGASGLFKLGQVLKNLSPDSAGAATTPFQYKMGNPPLGLSAGVQGEESIPGGSDYTAGGFPLRSNIVTPAPPTRLGLPMNATASEVEPMVGIRNDYPALASHFAKERVPANVFSKANPVQNGNFTINEDGEIIPNRLFLNAPLPKGKK